MKTKTTFLIITSIIFSLSLFGQSVNDYRTRQTGYWHDASTWERWNGSAWVNASTYPVASGSGVITIQAWHEIFVSITNLKVDQVVTWPLSVINIQTSGELEVIDGPGVDLAVYGTVIDAGELYHGSGSAIVFYDYSIYQHAQNSGRIPEATWYSASTIEIKDVYTTKPLGLSQSFGNFNWNCTYQSDDINFAGDLTQIQGNFTVTSTNGKELKMSNTATRIINVGGNFQLTNGLFILSGAGADNTFNINGNFTINGGSFWMSQGAGYATVNVKGNFAMSGGNMYQDDGYNRANFNFNGTSQQTYNRTAGTFYYGINFTIKSGASVDFGTSVLGNYLYTSGTFTLESGGTLKTAHADGISATSSVGCIQNYGSRSFHSNANYYYYKSGSQATGSGLPTTLGGLLSIGTTNNATNLNLTNSPTTINNKLLLVSNNSLNSSISSGTIIYGSSATLEYQGGSAQTTASGEFPASSGPYHLLINNPNGVVLHASRTLNGTLYLTIGNFSIGNNTLTLNGLITKTSGNLVGGNTSNLTFGGSGAATTLPAITLNNLTINRGNGINLGGNVTLEGTLSLHNGALSIGNYTMNLNGAITKTSGTLTGGNTSTIVFGGSGAATGLYAITLHTLNINRASGINMLGNVTIKNILNLTSGTFSIGNNTLYLDGFINQTSGLLVGGLGSNIEIGENPVPVSLSSLILQHLTINRMAGVNMAGDISVYGNLTLTNGSFSIGINTLTLYGFIVQTGGSLTGGLLSNLIFQDNTAPTSLPSITLNDLSVFRTGGVELAGDVHVTGDLTIEEGTLITNGWSLTTGTQTNINADGVLWIDANAQLRISSGTEINVNSGGMIKIVGDYASPAVVTQSGISKGYYGFAVNENGTIAAQFGLFEYMNLDGIYIYEGAFIDESYSFTNCTFQNGEPDGTLLTINNDQEIVIHDAIFPENVWGSAHNVGKDTDAGTVYFDDATGLFAGEAFENDPYDRINWSGGGGGDVQTLAIPEGWSGISTYIIPDIPDVEVMFQPIYNDLVMIYNQTGMYWPGQNINTLGNWNVYSGYVIKVLNDVGLPVTGMEVTQRTIPVKHGWNIIPVFSTVPAAEFLVTLPGFVVAKGIATGEILWPAFNIQTLEYLYTGKSYMVYSTMPGWLTYPLGSDGLQIDKSPATGMISSPWSPVRPTSGSHLVVFSGECHRNFEKGDVIGGFTQEGLCTGIEEISDKGKNLVLSLNADDPFTLENDGFVEGEPILFKLYRPSTDEIFDLDVTCNPEMNTGLYETNGLTEVKAIKMSLTGINETNAQVPTTFPNPSQGIFTIDGIKSKSIIQVINPSGEIIFSTTLSYPSTIDLTSHPAGMYFLSIKTENDMFFEKLIIK